MSDMSEIKNSCNGLKVDDMTANVLKLDGIWKLYDGEGLYNDTVDFIRINEGKEFIAAEVPGDIHADLFKAGRINDPYFGYNAGKCGWVTEKDWLYLKKFKIEKSFSRSKTMVVFKGIDTYAVIFFNGKKIGEANNMFLKYEFDVTGLIRDNEENELAVVIRSVKKEMAKFPLQKYFGCFNTPRIFIRKAQCHFGWDWAPELPAAGLWQGVDLVSYDKCRIVDTNVWTKTDGRITFIVELDYNIRRPEDYNKKHNDELLIVIEDGEKKINKKVPVRGQRNLTTVKIENPKLWWPNGYGSPNLYSYSVKLIRNGNVLDGSRGRFGIREVQLVQEPNEKDGFSFGFYINGKPIYSKGSNWVPVECFTGTLTDEKYRDLIRMAREGNMNMLRVWGGGFYEKDIFYDLCDENGIMVWQDFMFSCSDIPDEYEGFTEMVEKEAIYQIKRLRNHPGIIYWCGCNEKTGAFGFKDNYGAKTIYILLRGICGEYDPTRPYMPQSPISFSDICNDPESGDTHVNCLEESVKDGMETYREKLAKIDSAFNSETAILGPSRLQSIKKFIPEDKLWPLNELWEYRFLDNPYNSLQDITYLGQQKIMAEGLFGKFENLEEFIKKAMTAHSEILRSEIEHNRSKKWHSAGVMNWMFSDIWPTGTWALIDYYKLPKPAYYAAKRAYQPLLPVFTQESDGIILTVVNDKLEDISCNIEYGQRKVDGAILWSTLLENHNIKANMNTEIIEINGRARDDKDSYLYAKIRSEKYSTSTTFFHKLWKDIEWQRPEVEFSVVDEWFDGEAYKKTIKIESDQYARMVNLNLSDDQYAFYSDNFFDLEAGEKKDVTIESKEDFKVSDISIMHWLDEWT